MINLVIIHETKFDNSFRVRISLCAKIFAISAISFVKNLKTIFLFAQLSTKKCTIASPGSFSFYETNTTVANSLLAALSSAKNTEHNTFPTERLLFKSIICGWVY